MARTIVDRPDHAHVIRGLLQSCEIMLAIDEEYWIQWFSERAGQLHTKALVRVSTEQDAVACMSRMPDGVAGGVAFRVPRDRADGTYGDVAMLTMRGDVPGDCQARFRATLID